MSVRLRTTPKEMAHAKFGTGLSILCWPRSSAQVREIGANGCHTSRSVTTPRSILLLDFHNFFVFTGRQPLWTVDLFVSEAEGRGKTDPVYTAETVDRLNRAMHLVREHLQASASCASRWYNRKARPREFAQGDLVRVYCPRKFVGRTPKWLSFYATEGEVVRKLNDASYLVKSRAWKGQKVIHPDKLKPFLTFNN